MNAPIHPDMNMSIGTCVISYTLSCVCVFFCPLKVYLWRMGAKDRPLQSHGPDNWVLVRSRPPLLDNRSVNIDTIQRETRDMELTPCHGPIESIQHLKNENNRMKYTPPCASRKDHDSAHGEQPFLRSVEQRENDERAPAWKRRRGPSPKASAGTQPATQQT